MKKILLSILGALALLSPRLAAADTDATIAAVRAADDARVAASIAADRARLEAVYSDNLHYSHSSGKIDTKTSLVNALVTGTTKYLAIRYDDRNFKLVAPGVVLMDGHAEFRLMSNGQPTPLYLSFLAVWREEQGRWRFVAWQSCKIPAPAAPAAK
ncbi:MAG TPA: nuclear transport factor 2 family protein [Opitutaceae bacterium]|nr:nuclear transport factor 2 family protein [Opitutaceae bacterium]